MLVQRLVCDRWHVAIDGRRYWGLARLRSWIVAGEAHEGLDSCLGGGVGAEEVGGAQVPKRVDDVHVLRGAVCFYQGGGIGGDFLEGAGEGFRVAGVLSMFHIPEAGLLLLLAVDQVLDMGRSATNVFGNSIAAAVVSRWEKALR